MKLVAIYNRHSTIRRSGLLQCAPVTAQQSGDGKPNRFLVRISPSIRTAGALFLAFCIAGCGHLRETLRDGLGPAFEPTNHYSNGTIPNSVARIAFLPVYHEAFEDELVESINETFVSALNRTVLFEVAAVSRDALESEFGHRQFSSVAPIPHGLFSYLKSDFDADAVLLTELTQLRAYRPISVGIRARLIEIETGRIVWAFDEFFTASEPRVSAAAKRFSTAHLRDRYPLREGDGILQSPTRFSQYVAHEVFSTLPQR